MVCNTHANLVAIVKNRTANDTKIATTAIIVSPITKERYSSSDEGVCVDEEETVGNAEDATLYVEEAAVDLETTVDCEEGTDAM